LTEPVAVFSVRSVEEGADAWQAGARSARERRKRRRRVALGLAGLGVAGLLVAGAWLALRPPPGLPPGPWVIGFDAPLSVDDGGFGQTLADAATMAVDDINAAGGIGGATLELQLHDDPFDEAVAVANVEAMVADARVVAMVGAPQSGLVEHQIPVSNPAGLLQCSPSASDPILTRPEFGALQLRSAYPDRINFVRTYGTNAMEAPAMASFAKSDLGVDHVLLILAPGEDETGERIAESFTDAFEGLGGVITERTLNEGADPSTVLEPLSTGGPQAVYHAGLDSDLTAEVRLAMVDAGHGSLPFLTWEAHVHPGFPEQAGDSATGTYATRVALAPAKATFVDRFRATYDASSDEAQFAATGYACVEVVAEALRTVATTGTSAEGLREATRAVAVDPARQVETVLGDISFDENGDPLQQFVEIVRPDPDAGEDEIGWVIEKAAQDYGPIP
jgi:branched-chain amino acid transport system substrate-binding protein